MTHQKRKCQKKLIFVVKRLSTCPDIDVSMETKFKCLMNVYSTHEGKR